MQTLTFGALAAPFFSEACPRLAELKAYGKIYSPRYIREQRRLLVKHILSDDELCGIPITELKSHHAKAFCSRIIAALGLCRTSKGIIVLFKIVLKELYTQDYTAKDLSKNIRAVKYAEQVRGALTSEEIKQFLSYSFTSVFDRAFFTTTLLCGLRLGEITALRWCDINFTHGLINIRQAWKDNTTLGPPKSGKARQTWLPPHVKALLAELRASRPAADTALIFSSPKAGHLSGTYARRHLAAALHRIGIDDCKRGITFHSLRHSLKSLLTTQGLPEEMQQQLFGWSDSSAVSMARRYTHTDPAALKFWFDKCKV
jgi:integrase